MRVPAVARSTMASQKSRSSRTSSAPVERPSRELRTLVPARSILVKMSPTRPRAPWLWSIWRARVDLPQSMVPEKKTSSATRHHPRRRAGWHHDHRHGEFRVARRAVQPEQRDHLAAHEPRVDDGEGPLGDDEQVADAALDPRSHRAEPPLVDGALTGEDPGTVTETGCPRLLDVGGGAGLRVELEVARLAAEMAHACHETGLVHEVDPVVEGHVDHAVVGRDDDRGVVRHASSKLSQRGVDRLHLVAPLPRLAAVDVADLVDVAPVEVDEGSWRGPHG